MKKKIFTLFASAVILAFCFQHISAQFQIKIPKLPKVEKPKEQTPPSSSEQNNGNRNQGNQPERSSAFPANKQSKNTAAQAVQRPLPPNVPVFMANHLDRRRRNHQYLG
jgi:hypothetical protein